MIRIVALALSLLLTPRTAEACTTFQLSALFGKSYDWSMSQGLVVINKRGVEKQALALDPRETPARWTSKHASVTFNQFGVELPNGGMNDAGLVVEIMWLAASEPESRDKRPVVNELDWIQYQLDNFSTVAEMIAHKADVRVTPAYGKVHYLACDTSRACAAFEHLGGSLVVTPGAVVLTNDPHRDGLAFARGRASKLPEGTGSKERFARAAGLVEKIAAGSVTDAFTVLESVRVPNRTQWQIVYDLEKRAVHFRTSEHPAIKRIDLASFDQTCASPRSILDLAADAEGDVSKQLIPYSSAQNDALVRGSLAKIATKLPKGAVELIVAHPERATCSTSL